MSIKGRGNEQSELCVSVGTFDLLVMLHFLKKKINISKCLLLLILDP